MMNLVFDNTVKMESKQLTEIIYAYIYTLIIIERDSTFLLILELKKGFYEEQF